MIISVSRRTDIPAFYSNWFFNRIREGFVLVRNPMIFRQISRVKLTPDVVDGMVLWTKNPAPMLDRLDELRDYMYYFQFSITPYGRDVEPNIPQKHTDVLASFKKISETIGVDRVIWRYDPILLNAKYTFDYHLRVFEKIAKALHGHTRKVTISFIDTDYRGLKSNAAKLGLQDFPASAQRDLAGALARIAHEYGLMIDACAEEIDLHAYGIEKARCIDDRLFSKLLHSGLDIEKDKNQRTECGCVSSVDIGAYNTCGHGCLYCYANYNAGAIASNHARHNPLSPLLFGEIKPDDKITDRAIKVHRNSQVGLDSIFC